MKLKRFLSFAVALCMVMAFIPAMTLTVSAADDEVTQLVVGGITYDVISENLVANGTFEENTNGWVSWTGNKNTLGTFSRSTNQAHSGAYSLKCDNGGGGTSAGSLVGQFDLGEDVQAGDKYILSFWRYANTSDLTLTMGLGSDKSDAQVDTECGGFGNSGSDPISCNLSGLPTNQWHKIACVLTAKESSTYAEIYARWLTENTYFDDAELYKVKQVSTQYNVDDKFVSSDGAVYNIASENLITNGSFEDADGNFDTTGWLSQQKNSDIPNPTTAGDDHWFAGSTYTAYFMGKAVKLGSTNDRWGTKHVAPKVGNPTDGSWYITSVWNDGFGALCTIKRSFPVENGKKYVLLYDIKGNNGSKNASTVLVGTTLGNGVGTPAGNITADWKTVEYIVEGSDSVSEIWFNAYSMPNGQNNANGNGVCLDNFRMYEITEVAADAYATVNYVDENGIVVKTETVEGLVSDNAFVPKVDKNVIIDNVLYKLIENNGIASAVGGENVVTVKLEKMFGIVQNLIENGDFEDGMTGWDNLSADWFAVQNGELVSKATDWKSHEDCAIGGVRSFQKNVPVESGKVYYYTADVYTGGATGLWMNYSFINNTTPMTYGKTGNLYVVDGCQTNCTTTACASGTQLSAGYGGQWHTFSGLVTADDIAKMFEFDVYYLHDSVGSKFDNIAFYETDIPTATVKYVTEDGTTIKSVIEKLIDRDSFTTEDEEVYFAAKTGETCVDDNKNTLEFRSENAGYYILKSATAQAGEVVTGEVEKVANKYGVLKDTGGKSGGLYGVDNNNRAFASTTGKEVHVDANGEALAEVPAHAGLLGGDRWALLKFELPELEEGQKAALKVNVFEWHANGINSNGSNPGLKLIAYAVNEDDWTEVNELNYNVTAMTLIEGTNAIFSEWAKGLTTGTRNTTVTFDVTEAVKAAKAAGKSYIDFKISTPYGGAYITDREKAVVGNTSPYGTPEEIGKAAYIEVVDADAFAVTATGGATLTKNGSVMNGVAYVTADDDVRLVANGAVVVKTDMGYAYPNQNLALTEAAAFGTVEPKGFGLEMVGGAQVRVGGGVEEKEDGTVGVSDGSGLRFVATANKSETVLADENVEFGMKISAEGSTADPKYVKATAFQDGSDDVFTVAITNLATTNYIRNYTATPYALIPMIDGTTAELNAAPVTRSIYQVSAGILKNNAFETTEDYNSEVTSTILKVLNAYVNQVGIRLATDADNNFSVFNKAGSTGNYTGDVFFDVASEKNGNVVTVTVTPKTEEWVNPVEIASWWKNRIRVNNNNKDAVNFIDGEVDAETGVLTFTFTIPTAE